MPANQRLRSLGTDDGYYQRIRDDIERQAAALGVTIQCETCRDARVLKVKDQDRIIRCPDCTQDETRTRMLRRGSFAEKTFDHWQVTRETEAAYAACQELLGGGRWCVYLRGDPGVGKTHLAIATAVAWLDSGRGRPLVMNAAKMLDEMRETMAPDATRRLTPMLDLFASVSLLVIDDLGAEKATEWAAEQLFKIIDRRYAQKAPLLVTSNERGLADKLGRRTVDRLSPGMVVIEGESRRKEFDR